MTTALYDDHDVATVLTPQLAVAALQAAFAKEAAGEAAIPGRLNAPAPDGWIRLMPAVINGANGDSAMGFKVMNLNRATGVRYISFVYDAPSGSLDAIMDAARLTRIRTAAVTAIACRAVRPHPVRELGIFGSGHEAAGHLETFKALFPELERAVVWSPRQARREDFAARLSEQLAMEVRAADRPEGAAEAKVVVLATKATEVCARSDWFARGTLVLSIGSTRLDLRELDERTFARTAVCLGDAPGQLLSESGDVQAAVAGGFLDPARLVPLPEVSAGVTVVPWPPEDLLVFKSVGTALQDLAVARAVHAACSANGLGRHLDWEPVTH